MYDTYSSLISETRCLAFLKESKHATWQDAVKQQRVTEIEKSLGKYTSSNSLADIAKALTFQFSQWRRTHHQATALVADFPPQPKAG